MAVSFATPVDIGNRALQHTGTTRITSFTDDSKAAAAISFVYDKVRRAELRRNCWAFTTRKAVLRPVDTTCYQFVPAAYDPTKSYLTGSIVSYGGLIYHANGAVSVGLGTPDTLSPLWTLYFGPMMVSPWTSGPQGGPPFWSSATSYAAGFVVVGSDGNEYASVGNGNVGHNPVGDGGVHWTLIGIAPTGDGYYAGELVYYPAGPGAQIFLSLVSSNNVVPNVVPLWTSSTIYAVGDTATFGSTVYQSQVELNLNLEPDTNPTQWEAVPGTQTDQRMGQDWLLLGAATFTNLNIIYPIGAGPVNQAATRNVFLLPNGWLREAPQDPKAGQNSYLGAPTGLQQTDWNYEGDYIVSRYNQPIVYRFVADMAEVNRFDDMFCEGLACRIAMEVCEELTQSVSKITTISRMYQLIMGEAREVNGIEVGPVQSPEDDYIVCRI